MKKTIYHLYYYVPASHLNSTKKEIFAAGAGRIGNYSSCAFETKGRGQFLPEANSNPYLGIKGKVKKIIEYKVETVCTKKVLAKVIKALLRAHPYEEPAYGILRLS